MVMTATIILMFEPRDPIVKSYLARQSAFGQQFQRPIHGRKSDSRIFPLDQPVQFVSREMLPSFEEGSQNSIALRRLLEAYPLEMLMQNSLRLPHHFTRDTRLIIDASLQHESYE